jgi:signal transduction histidine kinase
VASERLASSLDWQTTVGHVAELALPALADLCIVSLVDGDERLARAAAAHVDAACDDEVRGALLAAAPSELERAVLQSRRPILRSDLEHGASADIDGALPRLFGARALLALPLVVADRAIGVLTLCAAGSGRRYDADDLASGECIAARAAQALGHARAHRELHAELRTRDELLGAAAHDLKNLVAVVKMNSMFMLESAPPNDRRASRQQLESIQRVAARMNELVRDLADVANIETGRFSVRRDPFTVRALLANVGAAMRPAAAERGVGLELVPPPDAIALRCDGARVEQVLASLVGNAIKLTPAGAAVQVRAARQASAVRFDVRDQGSGIATAEVARLFGRAGRSAQSARDGAGFGLFIARKIVEAHGGRISVDTVPGRGSTFSFTLPLDA